MPIVIASYTLFCIIISFPSVLFGILFWELLKSIWNTIKSKRKINLENLQLADGALREAIWEEYKEHTLTLINETEHDIRSCYVLLDEVAWKNFEGKWEVKAKEVFDRPFKWNRDAKLDGKLDIESGNRASFVFISHYQYSVYNATKKQNEVSTDFDFVFFQAPSRAAAGCSCSCTTYTYK